MFKKAKELKKKIFPIKKKGIIEKGEIKINSDSEISGCEDIEDEEEKANVEIGGDEAAKK